MQRRARRQAIWSASETGCRSFAKQARQKNVRMWLIESEGKGSEDGEKGNATKKMQRGWLERVGREGNT